MPNEDEYIAELVNANYVARELVRHSAVCDGEVWEKFDKDIEKFRTYRYSRFVRKCSVCEFLVNEIRKIKG